MSLFDQINTKDFGDATTGEKHLPIITTEKAGDKLKVKVDVGGGKHPNEIDHWFQWVELQINDLFVGRVEFSAVVMEPVAEFVLNVPGNAKTISAVTRCNKHGLWKSSISL